MSLKKQILIFIAQIIFCINGFAQRERIDSLKSILHYLRDSARVDCLNELALQLTYRNKKDSSEYYLSLAHEESYRMNYIRGIAGYFAGKALQKSQFGNDFTQSEVLARQSLEWYDKTPLKDKIGISYLILGNALFAQSKYNEATLYLNKAYGALKRDGDELRMFYIIDNEGNPAGTKSNK